MSLYPEIEKYIDILLTYVKKKSFSLGSLTKEYDGIKEDLISTNNENDPLVLLAIDDKNVLEQLLNVWFKIGVIALKKGKIEIYSTFAKRQLDITDYDKDFIIHPLFWRKKNNILY